MEKRLRRIPEKAAARRVGGLRIGADMGSAQGRKASSLFCLNKKPLISSCKTASKNGLLLQNLCCLKLKKIYKPTLRAGFS
jgi:hypothetical protein